MKGADAYVSAELEVRFVFPRAVAVAGLDVGVDHSKPSLSFHPPCRIDAKFDLSSFSVRTESVR